MEGASGQLRRGKTVEQIYQKKTQLEHILLRPDTYVGSTEHQHQDMFVFDERRGEIVHRKIDYVPALYKIFDEILVNAADNSMRDTKGMDLLDITIDRHAGCISVMNNGKGVPVVIHKEHNCYVPELIFGHLLTSDNYDDNEKKVTGGRNGYGAKLTNVFSTKFVIETADRSVKKRFSQTFEKNMSVKHKPQISDYTGSDFTRVTFWPDLAKFGMVRLDDDIVGLMMKRAYDVAGSTRRTCRVVLNGKKLPVTSFEDYVQLYLSGGKAAVGLEDPGPAPCIYERCGERWEVAVSVSDNGFSQVSHVNSICTTKGGTHVAHVSDQLVEAILKVVKGKNRGGIEIKPQHVRNHLWVFVNCLIENPAFDSQTKETLTTKQSKFGSSCEISEKTMRQVLKSGVVDMILDWAKAKQKVDLGRQLKGSTKNQQRVLGVPKLEDANDAGGKDSHLCTLILTEGDSAKSLAVAGLSIVGRDRFGVFPLRGKVLNVRDANYKQVTGNAEIQNLLKITGLDVKREYDSTRSLRYGSIMIMTDQDHDGSHIKGLLINLVHHWWPSLMKMNGFMKEFVTPIVKVWKDGKREAERKDEKCFFTMNEYEKWQQRSGGGRGWKSKYYKGLGTSTAKEAKEYFKDIEKHELSFRWQSDRDGEAIDLAFNKKRANDRKEWINGYVEGTHVDHSQSHLSYFDFVNKELVQFAKYDTSRSVPSMVDGLKPGQRKVLFCSFKKKLKNDIKVAQFVGYISEHAAYHHGEASLENTIINLAQNFVGSNNMNLFVPSGQFGTRLQGGKDHAASRYIYTRLSPVTRLAFHPDDDKVLTYLNEEGQKIEPQWYCPILPTVLVNGADGIGTGWSTFVPNYNPREIVKNIRRLLRGQAMQDMLPWYKGFKGTIVPSPKEEGKFEMMGCIEKRSETSLVITELPVKSWTQNYKEFLEELMPQDAKRGEEAPDSVITDYREYHTENTVHFELSLTAEQMRRAESAGLEKTFKLKTSIAATNMVLFDAEGKITKYSTALDILKDFCQLRLKMYEARKAYLVAKLTREKEILSNKARFILMVVKGELELRKKKKADLLVELQRLGFKKMSELNAILEGIDPEDQESAAAGGGEGEGGAEKTDYDYLLSMPLWSLTFEKVEEIKKLRDLKIQELEELKRTTIEMMWDRDLEALLKCLDELEAQEAEEDRSMAQAAEGRRRKAGARGMRGPAPPAPAAPLRSKRARPDDDDDDGALLKRPLQASVATSAADLLRRQETKPAPRGGFDPFEVPPFAAFDDLTAARAPPFGGGPPPGGPPPPGGHAAQPSRGRGRPPRKAQANAEPPAAAAAPASAFAAAPASAPGVGAAGAGTGAAPRSRQPRGGPPPAVAPPQFGGAEDRSPPPCAAAAAAAPAAPGRPPKADAAAAAPGAGPLTALLRRRRRAAAVDDDDEEEEVAFMGGDAQMGFAQAASRLPTPSRSASAPPPQIDLEEAPAHAATAASAAAPQQPPRKKPGPRPRGGGGAAAQRRPAAAAVAVDEEDEENQTLDKWMVKRPFQESAPRGLLQPPSRAGAAASATAAGGREARQREGAAPPAAAAAGASSSGASATGASALARLLGASRAQGGGEPFPGPGGGGGGGGSLLSGGGEDMFAYLHGAGPAPSLSGGAQDAKRRRL